MKLKRLASLVLASALVMTSIPASIGNIGVFAASTDATSIKMIDEYGKDLTSNSILYVDNNSFSEGNIGNTETYVDVEINNNNGTCNDSIVVASRKVGGTSSQEKRGLYVRLNSLSNTKSRIYISGYTSENGKDYVSTDTGTYNISVTTTSGSVYRNFVVVVQKPAEKLNKISVNKIDYTKDVTKPVRLPDKDRIYSSKEEAQAAYDAYGSSFNQLGFAGVTNHKYDIDTTFNAGSTDIVEYKIYDGYIASAEELRGKEEGSLKAEISENGVLTPKENGMITVVIKPKATEISQRNTIEVERKVSVKVGTEEDNKVEKITYIDKTLPVFAHVIMIKENPAKALKINNKVSNLRVGQTYQLNIEKIPSYEGEGYESGATDEIKWVSSNTDVLKVDEKGKLTAVAKGSATVTAYGENSSVFVSCNIDVIAVADGITINPSPASTRVGIGVELTATLNPEDSNDTITWKSSNESVARVEVINNGENKSTVRVVGVNKGQVIITARANLSGVEGRCTVTVDDKILSDNLKITKDDGEISEVSQGDRVDVYTLNDMKINAELMASDGSTPDDKIKWTITGNNEYASIIKGNKSLSIHAISEGTFIVKAESEVNPSINQTFSVRVLRNCDSITFYEDSTGLKCSSKSLSIGDELRLNADLRINTNYPYNHQDTVKKWESSDESIAIVEDGRVVAIGVGTAKIKVTTSSGKYAACSVKVFITKEVVLGGVIASEDGSMPKVEMEMRSTTAKKLTATVTDQNGNKVSNNVLEWESSDESIVKVDGNGSITPVNKGDAIVTVTSGSKSDSCRVYVRVKSSDVKVEDIEDCAYSPVIREYTPEVSIKFGNNVLIEGKDYTVTYNNNTKVGTGTAVIQLRGEYKGTINQRFKIVKRNLGSMGVEIPTIEKQTCTGTYVKPNIAIKCDGVILKRGTDYSVSYADNKKPGIASATITGEGSFIGTKVIEFELYCSHEDVETVRVIKQGTCKEPGEVRVECTVCGTQFNQTGVKADHEYILSGIEHATCTNNGKSIYVCNVCGVTKTEVIGPTGHNMRKSKTVEPTYLYKGYDIYKCSRCGLQENRNFVNKLMVTPVTGLKVTSVGTNSATLSWNVISKVEGYIVYRYDNSRKAWVRVAKIKGNKNNVYKVADLKSGTRYRFGVKAYRTENVAEVASSLLEVSIDTKMARVTGFKVSATTTSSIKLAWNKASNAQGYIIYQQKSGKWVRIAKTQNTSNVYTVSKLKIGTTYKFAVRAYRTVKGKESASTSYPTLSASTNPAIVSFKLSAGSKKATVKWSKVTGATGYIVYYKTSAKGKWTKLTTTKNTTTSYTKAGLTKGKTYYFTVKAYRTVNGNTYNGAFTTKSVKVK